MGCDIHIKAQKRDGDSWVNVNGDFTEGSAPFDWRSYGLFGFLAGVRNYSDLTPISEPRGLPEGVTEWSDNDETWFGDHSHSWLSVEELSAFNYDAAMEDRRVGRQLAPNLYSGACTAEPGGGKMTTYREFLGEAFFADLHELRRIGAERIVFGFDS